MKKLIILMIAVTFTSLSYAQIVSTTTGGNWNNPKTWVGGVVPTKNDDVIINGTVIHSGKEDACRNLLIKEGKTLTTLSAQMNGYVVQVYGNLTNNGTIENNKAGNWLQLFIYKNIVNNGEWTNYGVSLMGNTDQTISVTKPIACYFIQMQNNNNLITGSDIKFLGTTLLFYKKNGFVIQAGRKVIFTYSDAHKQGEFMPPTNTARGVQFKGGGTVLSDGKYQFGNCIFDGVVLKKIEH